MSVTRRSFVQAGLALGATPLIAGMPALAANGRTRLTYATLKTGVSVIINEYLKAKRPDLDNGLDIDIVSEYTSVSSYYSDFISSTFELGIGAWDTYLRMHRKGVPARLATSVTTGTMISIVTREGGPSTVEELKGRSLAATASAGAFTMCKAAIGELHGIDLGKDVTVQNVPSPAQAMTLLLAGNVDAALSWEPNVAAAMARAEGLHPIFNLGQQYRAKQGAIMPYFSFAVRDEALQRDPEIGARVHATFAQLVDQINADPAEAFAIAAPHLNVEPEVLETAYDSGRLEFLSQSMIAPEGRELVRKVQAFMEPEDGAIGDDFFVG